ncbi:MAG: DUF2911 domain-containing protein, partial [Bacteroidota bacterium]
MTLKVQWIALLVFLSLGSKAQVEYLRLSPAQKIQQRVGMTDIELAFFRPQMKGRKIFGDLVPYGKMWRTGANENTTISFDHRIKIGETEVAAGKYALFTKPMETQWEIYFYKKVNNLDVPNPIDSTQLIYLTTVPSVEKSTTEETLVINFYSLTETTATLGIQWERTYVGIPLSFYTQEVMEKRMAKTFKKNILDYSIAASYYAQRGIELEKAKELRKLVLQLKEVPSAWDLYIYGSILLKMGQKEK